jgi:DnaJ-class molecular chaperone
VGQRHRWNNAREATMTARVDLYATLGLPSRASAAEITHAYRALLRELHPDTRIRTEGEVQESDSRLQQVLDAYAVLGDPDRRAEYDRTLRYQQPSYQQPSYQQPSDRQPSDRQRPPIRVGPIHWSPWR